MDEKKPVDIPPPPRAVPDEVRQQLKRSVLVPRLFGAIWLSVGLVMLVIFLLVSHPLVDERIRRDHKRAVGIVSRVERVGERNPYRVEYTFTADDGAQYPGRSFTGKRPALKPNDEVTVQYVPGRPQWSRIEGMHYGVLPPTLHLLPLFFIISGGLIWFTGVAKLGRLRRLYAHGVVTTGTVVGEKWHKLVRLNTGFRSPSRFLYELRYRFTDAFGRERDAGHRTYAVADSLHFAAGDTITVLFDRANPARSMAADMLNIESAAASHR